MNRKINNASLFLYFSNLHILKPLFWDSEPV